jgi:hypothetical protein
MALLYFSGAVVWILDRWFKVDNGMGLEPEAHQLTVLHFHSIIGLWFIFLFGYVFHAHVLIGWRRKKKLKSGVFLVIAIAVLILTVPGLFYLTDEGWKSNVSLIHTYLGLSLIAPFFTHWAAKS